MSGSEKVKPLGNRVLVKRLKAVTTKGGIILPESAQEKPKEGIVLAVGTGKVTDWGVEPMTVQVNDQVMFSSYSGTEVKDYGNEDEEFLIMSEEDIFGVISKV